jgi:hypothetical protein
MRYKKRLCGVQKLAVMYARMGDGCNETGFHLDASAGVNLRPLAVRAQSLLMGFSSFPDNGRKWLLPNPKLVRSPGCGSDAKHYLRAAVQLDVLFRA